MFTTTANGFSVDILYRHMEVTPLINSVYDYYISTYGNRTVSRHDSHKRSELRDIYNNIVKINRAAPLYKVDTSESSQKLAIDIKEAARALTDTLSEITDIADDDVPVGITASSDNPSLVTAEYSGDDMPEDKNLTFNVKQLASPQVNIGEYVSSGAKILFPGTYSFNIETANSTYSLEFAVGDNDNNGTILGKLAKSISSSGIGLDADVISNQYAQKALKITSQATGSRKDSPTQFRITEGNSNHLTGAVKLFGLDNISNYPSNAVFNLNGKSTISENNSFLVDGCYEVTLHGTSDEYGEGTITAMKDGSTLIDEYNRLADNYNRFLELSNRKDTHELRMLRSTVTSTVKRCRTTLEDNGFTVNDDNTLSINKEALDSSAKSGTIFDNLKNLGAFKEALKKRIDNIEINPMEYINKKVVAYKNPQRLITTPYATSIYTGMMFDRSL